MSEFQQGHALVIGVGADLANTVVDAKGIADVIRDPELCAYPSGQVNVLTEGQATRDGILQALDRLASQVTSESTVIVYFSGHGYVADTGFGKQYFLMPNDYDTDDLVNSTISSTEFIGKLKAIAAQKMLVLLDCCYAGGIDNEAFEKKAPAAKLVKAPLPANAVKMLGQGQGRVIISSCKESEVSYTGEPYSQFTQALVEAFAGAEASSQDGFVRAADLALYAARTVPKFTKDRQHPDLHFSEADNFAVAYYAGGETKPKGLPKQSQRNPNVEATNADEAKTSINVNNSGSGAAVVGDNAKVATSGGIIADNNSGVIAGTVAGDVVTGTKRSSVFDQSGQTIKGNQTNVAGDISTGGGAYVGGNVRTGGDFVGRDKIVRGDEVRGDKIGGDKYKVGDITGSSGIAIGRNSQATVNQGISATDLVILFAPLMQAVQSAPADKQGEAMQKVSELIGETQKGKEADDSRIGKLIDGFVGLVPSAVSTVVSAFASPILAGIAGPVTKYVLEKIQGR